MSEPRKRSTFGHLKYSWVDYEMSGMNREEILIDLESILCEAESSLMAEELENLRLCLARGLAAATIVSGAVLGSMPDGDVKACQKDRKSIPA